MWGRRLITSNQSLRIFIFPHKVKHQVHGDELYGIKSLLKKYVCVKGNCQRGECSSSISRTKWYQMSWMDLMITSNVEQYVSVLTFARECAISPVTAGGVLAAKQQVTQSALSLQTFQGLWLAPSHSCTATARYTFTNYQKLYLSPEKYSWLEYFTRLLLLYLITSAFRQGCWP